MSLIHCSSLATASSSLAHGLPSSLSLLPFLTISSNLSLSLSPHNPSSMCASPLLLLLCFVAHICSPPFPPSLPVLLCPSAVSSGPYLSHFSGFSLMAQGEQPLFSAPESCHWWFGRMMNFGCVDSHLLITWFCTLL